MQISGSSIKDFRVDFSKAVKELEAKYGVNISLGGITYESGNFRGKMTVTNGEKVERVVKKSSSFGIGDLVKINHKKVSSTLTWKVIKINKLTSRLQSSKTGNFVKCSNSFLLKA